MFKLNNAHKDWYQDGWEGGEELYRLDFIVGENNSLQAQLFLPTVDPKNPDDDRFHNPRLFIERDNRHPDGDSYQTRVDYACKSWPLTEQEAADLLAANTEQAMKLMADKINTVTNLPNDREFIRKYAGKYLPMIEAYWASIDNPKT